MRFPGINCTLAQYGQRQAVPRWTCRDRNSSPQFGQLKRSSATCIEWLLFEGSRLSEFLSRRFRFLQGRKKQSQLHEAPFNRPVIENRILHIDSNGLCDVVAE